MSLGSVAELTALVAGTALGDERFPIERIASIDDAGPDALTFATSAAYFTAALRSRAGAVLVDEAIYREGNSPQLPPHIKALILVPSARVALMHVLRSFERARPQGPSRHRSAVVDETAQLGEQVVLGPGAAVGARARIGDRAHIGASAYVGDDAVIGDDTLLHPHACVMDGCVAGKRVILHPGATIGSDGFGYVFIDGRFERIPQVGNVVLGDDVEIGANTCVDRAQTGSTLIGDGTKIDNLCQIGHNCRIGRHTGMAAQTGLAGSTNIGDYVLIGGQAGFKGHITIGSRVKIAAGAKVWGDLPDDSFVSGTPARPHQDDLRREVMLRNLPKLVARVDALEKKKQP